MLRKHKIKYMLKKFESLGTVLSRDEAKKIVGGLGEGNVTVCTTCGPDHVMCVNVPIEKHCFDADGIIICLNDTYYCP